MKKGRLRKDEFVPFAPARIGEQTSRNHEGCSAGTDTKKRLYIKRVPGGILAYCQHCSYAGYDVLRKTDEDADTLRRWIKNPDSVDLPIVNRDNDVFQIWESYKDNKASWETQAWLERYHFKADNTAYRFDNRGRVCLCIKDMYSRFLGYQVRNPNTVPKYISHYYAFRPLGGSWNIQGAHTLVITEDILSGLRIGEASYNSLALMGTVIKQHDEETLIKNSKAFQRIILWLDADEAGVKGTKALWSRLKFLLPDTLIDVVSRLGIEKEAKQYPAASVAKIIGELS
jgi:hypothetical protein